MNMLEEKIEGEKIYLRPITVNDTELIIKWRNNPRVQKCFIYQKPFTKESQLEWFETKIKTGQVIQFIICIKETGQPIGSVYFHNISKEHHRAEYGIFIGEDNFIGKGFGTKACKLACKYGFENELWHKIVLRLLSNNLIAYKSYKKAGFKKEAFLRDEVYIDGVYRNVILMGLLKKE